MDYENFFFGSDILAAASKQADRQYKCELKFQ